MCAIMWRTWRVRGGPNIYTPSPRIPRSGGRYLGRLQAWLHLHQQHRELPEVKVPRIVGICFIKHHAGVDVAVFHVVCECYEHEVQVV